jgi:hypothetical protein
VLFKGAGFSSMRNTPRAKKGLSGTDFSLCGFAPAKRGAQAKLNRKPTDRSLCYRPAGKGKSRIGKPAPLNTTRVRHPKIQNRSKAGPPARKFKTPQRVGRLRLIIFLSRQWPELLRQYQYDRGLLLHYAQVRLDA